MADPSTANPTVTPHLQAESAVAAAAAMARSAEPVVKTSAQPSVLPRVMLGEFLGTFVLVFFGVGVVNAAVATGTQVGLWQVAVVWAIGVTLGIYSSAAMSGAHLNPAITLVGVVFDRFPIHRAIGYVLAQVAGAMAASAVLYTMFAEAILEFERRHGLLRGGPGSERSAMVFGEYFPNPAVFGTAEDAWRIVGPQAAFMAEMIGTAMLAFLIAAVTHPRNSARPPAAVQALFIGLGVAAIISVVAPLTQAGLNPARDFGPRLVSWFLGWGEIAIPGPRGGWFSVYVVAPCVGALIGGGLYRLMAGKLLAPATDEREP